MIGLSQVAQYSLPLTATEPLDSLNRGRTLNRSISVAVANRNHRHVGSQSSASRARDHCNRLRGLAHAHCTWAHKECNWDRNRRCCAHADCT